MLYSQFLPHYVISPNFQFGVCQTPNCHLQLSLIKLGDNILIRTGFQESNPVKNPTEYFTTIHYI